MTKKPLVSVIIIIFNAERFIEEAIESVIGQTYSNWEILFVDDGSTDNSSEIAIYYAALYNSRVRYLEHDRHENRGMSASRNLGIRNSNGEYITFLDADDVWLPHKLEQAVNVLEVNKDAALVYGPGLIWFSWTGKPEDASRDYIEPLPTEPNTLIEPPELLSIFLRSGNAPSFPVIRREVIEGVGGFEDSFRDMYEDQVFYAKVCLKVTVYVVAECWYKHRRHASSCTYVAVKAGKNFSARLIFLKWLEDYLLRNGEKGSEVWKILQNELWRCRHPRLVRQKKRLRSLKRKINDFIGSLFLKTFVVIFLNLVLFAGYSEYY